MYTYILTHVYITFLCNFWHCTHNTAYPYNVRVKNYSVHYFADFWKVCCKCDLNFQFLCLFSPILKTNNCFFQSIAKSYLTNGDRFTKVSASHKGWFDLPYRYGFLAVYFHAGFISIYTDLGVHLSYYRKILTRISFTIR